MSRIAACLALVALSCPVFAQDVDLRQVPYAPRPPYPKSMRDQKIEGGWGQFLLHIDTKTGLVTAVEVAQSTGVRLLDKSAIDTFSRWRFRRGSPPIVRLPVKFSMHGPQEMAKLRGSNDPASLALEAPLPTYPLEARLHHIAGCGKFQIENEQKTGRPVKVLVIASTGNPLLDGAAINAFMRWRMHPNSPPHILIPVCFDFTSGRPAVHY